MWNRRGAILTDQRTPVALKQWRRWENHRALIRYVYQSLFFLISSPSTLFLCFLYSLRILILWSCGNCVHSIVEVMNDLQNQRMWWWNAEALLAEKSGEELLRLWRRWWKNEAEKWENIQIFLVVILLWIEEAWMEEVRMKGNFFEFFCVESYIWGWIWNYVI